MAPDESDDDLDEAETQKTDAEIEAEIAEEDRFEIEQERREAQLWGIPELHRGAARYLRGDCTPGTASTLAGCYSLVFVVIGWGALAAAIIVAVVLATSR